MVRFFFFFFPLALVRVLLPYCACVRDRDLTPAYASIVARCETGSGHRQRETATPSAFPLEEYGRCYIGSMSAQWWSARNDCSSDESVL